MIQLSEHKKKYLLNTSWVFLGFGVRYGLNLVVSIYMARYLAPEGFGMLNYSTNYMQMLTPLAWLSLHGLIIRDLAKGAFNDNKILGTTFLLKIISSIITYGIIILIAYTTESNAYVRLLILIASLSILISPLNIIEYFFQAKIQSKYVVIAQQTAYITTSIIRIFLIYYQFPVIAFVWMVFVDVLIASIFLLIYYYKKYASILTWKIDLTYAKSIMYDIPMVVLADFFLVVYMRIDIIMIEKMLGSKELGIYTAAIKLCEPFYMVSTLIITSLLTAIINGLKISRAEYLRRMNKLFNLLTFIAIVVSIIVSLVSSTIINLLFGIEYAQSASILTLYFWSSVFVFQASLAANAFLIEKIQHYTVIYTFSGALLNIGLNLWLIPSYGLQGAAIATLISYAFSGYLFNAIFPATRHVFIQQSKAYINIFSNPLSLIQELKSNKDA